MKLKHIALIGSLFPILFSLVLFFGVLISADSDDENSNFSSGITGMNLSAEVLKHQPSRAHTRTSAPAAGQAYGASKGTRSKAGTAKG